MCGGWGGALARSVLRQELCNDEADQHADDQQPESVGIGQDRGLLKQLLIDLPSGLLTGLKGGAALRD